MNAPPQKNGHSDPSKKGVLREQDSGLNEKEGKRNSLLWTKKKRPSGEESKESYWPGRALERYLQRQRVPRLLGER